MYYVIEITQGDASVNGKSIYEYKTLQEAKSSFYKKYGTALGSDLYTGELILLADDKGTIFNIEHFEKDI